MQKQLQHTLFSFLNDDLPSLSRYRHAFNQTYLVLAMDLNDINYKGRDLPGHK